MSKEDLIKKLQLIEGNPIVLLNDSEFDFIELRSVELRKVHQSKNEPDMYINDFDYQSRIGNTYYHDNYESETRECVLLSL